jgi:hypothetical protein
MGHLVDTALDVALVGGCCVYAHWLDEHKGLEPDHTWFEVTVGVAACLAHAALRGRGATKDAYQALLWRSFALGGAPIIVGELHQALRRRRARDLYLAQGPLDIGD